MQHIGLIHLTNLCCGRHQVVTEGRETDTSGAEAGREIAKVRVGGVTAETGTGREGE